MAGFENGEAQTAKKWERDRPHDRGLDFFGHRKLGYCSTERARSRVGGQVSDAKRGCARTVQGRRATRSADVSVRRRPASSGIQGERRFVTHRRSNRAALAVVGFNLDAQR